MEMEVLSSTFLEFNTTDPIQFVRPLIKLTFWIALTAWFLQIMWKRRKLYIYSWNVPGPLSFPLIGSAHYFLGDSSDIMGAIVRFQKEYPGLGKLWLGPRLMYSVSDPEQIEKILTHPKSLEKADLYKFLSFVIGTGLITSPVPKWRKHRKVIMPAFNQKILDSYVEIFARQSEIFADQLKKYIGNKNFDMFLLLSNCTLDIICETAMGVQMHIQTSNSTFGTNLDRLMEITTYRIFRIWHHLEFTWKFYPLSREYARCIEEFRNVTSSIIKRKMEEYEAKKKLQEDSVVAEIEGGLKREKIAFLDLIMENSNFTEEELKEEVEIFMIAGSDTSASSMNCILMMLGMHPEIQQRVFEEIVDTIGPDRTVLPSDLPNLKYMDRVIKESLRVFPVAAFFLRNIGEDIDLGEAVIPAGASAFFGPVHIHRNPKYWPDPLKFDPDRFLPENVAQRHPCAYVAFSYGPRNCIGGRYAMMNMKTILATVLRRYRIFTAYKTIEEIELKSNIVLKLKNGSKIWIESR